MSGLNEEPGRKALRLVLELQERVAKLEAQLKQPAVDSGDTDTHCSCGGKWGIDGQHSNEYCKKCYKSRPPYSV